MRIWNVTSHQALFLEAINLARSVSSEFSGDIRGDALRLREWATQYTEMHGLKLPEDAEAFGIYYEYEESDTPVLTFYVGLDGHWYLRESLTNVYLWRSPWRKPEGWNGR